MRWCYSCHSTILERQEGAQLRVQMMNGLGTNFCQLPTRQEVQRYHASRCSSYEQPGSSLLIIYSSATSAAAIGGTLEVVVLKHDIVEV